MMTKTLFGVASLVLARGVCFADDASRDADASRASVPADGWRANVTIGAAQFPTNSNAGTGGSTSVMWGYESMHDRVGLDFGLEVEAQIYSGSAVSVDTYSARPTVRLEYYGEHWLPYGSLGIGYTYASGSNSASGMSVSESDNMLAIAASAGIGYRLTNRIALGPYVRYEPCFEPALNQFVDFGLALEAH